MDMLLWLVQKSTAWVKQKQHCLTTKFHRKIQSKNSICWCGSAVEHHLGKVGVTGPIPVTSSIIKNPWKPSKIGTFKGFLFF